MTREQLRNGGQKALAVAGALLLAATAAPHMTSAEVAFAADETRTYSWANGQSQPSIPQTIQGADGQTMTLVSQTQPVQADASRSITQSFSETRSQRLSSSEIGNAASIMPQSIHIDSDGFVGDIPRTSIDQNPVMRTDTEKKTISGSGRSMDNSVSSVPKTSMSNGRTYYLNESSIKWTPVYNQSTGDQLLYYTYTATYEATVTTQVVDYYDVTAHYQGNVTKYTNEGDWSVSVVYHSDDRPAEQPRQEQPQNQNRNDDSNDDSNDDDANRDDNDEQNTENENAEGVNSNLEDDDETGNFGEPENANASDTVSPFTNRNSSSDNDNYNANASNDNANAQASPDEPEKGLTIFGLPWLPFAIGAGVLLAALLAALIILLAKKNKKKKEQQAVESMMMAGTAGAAGVAGVGAGMVAAAVAYEEEPVSQLIAIGTITDEEGNIDYDQQPRADLAIYPSRHEAVPTLVKFPPMEDENGERVRFEPEEDRSYWIAIDEEVVNSAVSHDMLVATDDNCEIYRGPLADQFELSTEQMAAALNGELEGADVSDELASYDAIVPFEVAPPKMVPVEVPADSAYYEPDAVQDGQPVFGDADEFDDFDGFADPAFPASGMEDSEDEGLSELDDMDLDELSFDDSPSEDGFDDVDDLGSDDLYGGFDDITIDADDGMPDDAEYFETGEPLVFADAQPAVPETQMEDDSFDDLDFEDMDEAGFTIPSDEVSVQDVPAADDFDDVDFEDMDFAAPVAEPIMQDDLFSQPEPVFEQPSPSVPQEPEVFSDFRGDAGDDFDDLDDFGDLDFSDADFSQTR